MALVTPPLSVVKVGGSLFDDPRLGKRLRSWVYDQPNDRILLVAGGGAMADVVRAYQQTHGLSEEECHWLAIQSMTINARLLQTQIPECLETGHPKRWPGDTRFATLDTSAFCRQDECEPHALPHSWDVTSDSIAARVAEVANAQRLVLLKSTVLPRGVDWSDAARMELVDPTFPQIVKRSALRVEWINFRG